MPSMSTGGTGDRDASGTDRLPLPRMWGSHPDFGMDSSAERVQPSRWVQPSGDSSTTSSRYRLIGWGNQSEIRDPTAGFQNLGDLVNLSNSLVYW